MATIQTVAGTEDGVVDRTAVDIHIGLGQVATGTSLGGSNLTHNVGTAIDDADIASSNLDVGVVERTGALAAAIDGVDNDVVAVNKHVGATLGAFLVVGVAGGSDALTSVVVSIGVCCQHHALVAAAIDIVDTAPGEVQRRQAAHIGSVVAAEEAADIEYASGSGVGVGRRVGIGRSGQGVERVGHIDVDRRAGHVGAVAATEEGIDLATVDIDFNRLAANLVAAAEEVAYTVLAVIAGPGTAISVGAAQVDRRAVVGLGAVDIDDLFCSSQGAAEVVATENGVYDTAVDVDIGVVPFGTCDESILGTAKEGVDTDEVGVDRDGGLADGGDGTRRDIAVAASHISDTGAESPAGKHRSTHSHAGSVVVILVVAVATAIDRADVDFTISDTTGVASQCTDSDGRTVGTGDGTSDVIATIDGRDSVAVYNSHNRIGSNVGHTTATKYSTADTRLSLDRSLCLNGQYRKQGKRQYKQSSKLLRHIS